MMASVNKWIGIGNVGKIDTRFSQSGGAITNFSLACNETYKDKSGKKVDKTEWVSCVAYRKLAEIMQQYVVKGSQIYVEGRLETTKYTDKQGIERYQTRVTVNDMKMIGKKPGNQNSSHADAGAGRSDKSGFEDMDDDIPF